MEDFYSLIETENPIANLRLMVVQGAHVTEFHHKKMPTVICIC